MATLGDNSLQSEEEKLYSQLLLQAAQSEGGLPSAPTTERLSVTPKPGFCIKTKTDKDEKVFINICVGDNLPVPKLISDEEILKLIEAENPTGFRIPLSIGEPHAEVDRSGKGCTAYDVVVNPEFLQRVNRSHILMGFFLSVAIEGLEYKYNLTLDRHWVMLKNRKFVGSLPEQNIRSQSKPLIMDMETSESNAIQPARSLVTEVSSDTAKVKAPEPSYTIIQDPAEGHPEYLVAEIKLSKIKTAASLTLDIGEDRIYLTTRANIYGLDIFLPYNLIQEECGAQFDRKSRILTLTMPVQPIMNE